MKNYSKHIVSVNDYQFLIEVHKPAIHDDVYVNGYVKATLIEAPYQTHARIFAFDNVYTISAYAKCSEEDHDKFSVSKGQYIAIQKCLLKLMKKFDESQRTREKLFLSSYEQVVKTVSHRINRKPKKELQ